MNTRDLPGSLDFVQCVDGKDTIIQDYAQVDGWQNAEVMDIIAQLEQSITTREISPVPAVNFHITDDNIGEGGPKQKFARNIAAIETLFKLESENRNATPEEQEICRIMSVGAVWQMPLTRTREIGRRSIRH